MHTLSYQNKNKSDNTYKIIVPNELPFIDTNDSNYIVIRAYFDNHIRELSEFNNVKKLKLEKFDAYELKTIINQIFNFPQVKINKPSIYETKLFESKNIDDYIFITSYDELYDPTPREKQASLCDSFQTVKMGKPFILPKDFRPGNKKFSDMYNHMHTLFFGNNLNLKQKMFFIEKYIRHWDPNNKPTKPLVSSSSPTLKPNEILHKFEQSIENFNIINN